MALKDNIKKYRELRGWSVEDLASNMKIGKAGIYKWESGENTPSLESLTLLSQVLEAPISVLLDENPTLVQEATNNTENMEVNENVYRTIVEGNTEYVLIPRNILEKTQLVSAEQVNKTWAELERKNGQIDYYQTQLAKLLDRLDSPSKVVDSEEGKEKV